MSWCDKLASRPSAGFLLSPNYLPSSDLMRAFTPLFNENSDENKAHFTIDVTEEFKLVYATNSGIQTSVEPTKVAAAFVYKLRAKSVSAGPPILEMQSKPQPFTAMLPVITKKLIDATLRVPGEGRLVKRVGVVSTTAVDEEIAPPGILKMIEHFRKPWGKFHGGYNYNFTVVLDEKADHIDRCIINLVKTEEEDGLLNMSFDWQRVIKGERAVTKDNLCELCSTAEKNSLEYFETLAEGVNL